jgi:hypothetical protein
MRARRIAKRACKCKAANGKLSRLALRLHTTSAARVLGKVGPECFAAVSRADQDER